MVFWESAGNHVIRYNECWSDKDHYFNDGMGAGSNGGYRGFPGADSDIYCNYVANCWDDGIEAEGGDQNVRIWNNYVEDVLIPIANAAVSIGPLYVWRNVSGRSYSPPGSSWDMTHGPFMKMGYAGGEKWMTGQMYFFNNTIFQGNNDGASAAWRRQQGHQALHHAEQHPARPRGGPPQHCRPPQSCRQRLRPRPGVRRRSRKGHEKHGTEGMPSYAEGAGFDSSSKTGMFRLAPGQQGGGRRRGHPEFL